VSKRTEGVFGQELEDVAVDADLCATEGRERMGSTKGNNLETKNRGKRESGLVLDNSAGQGKKKRGGGERDLNVENNQGTLSRASGRR